MRAGGLALGQGWWTARDGVIVAGYLALYLLLDVASYIYPWARTAVTPWNPPPALSLALLLVFGLRFAPALFVAPVISDLVVHAARGSLVMTLLGSTVLALGYVSMAVAVGRFTQVLPGGPRNARDFAVFLGIVGGLALVIGAAFAGLLASVGGIGWPAFADGLVRFWVGDVVGILVNLPLLLILADPASRARFGRMLAARETHLQIAAVLLALWLVFGLTANVHVRYLYLLFLPVVWIAARHGLVGAAFGVVVAQVGVIVAVELKSPSALTVLELQAVMLGLAVTALLLGVVVDERERAQENLQQSLRLAAAGEMAAALAHELNQPLTAIVTYAKACDLMLSDRQTPHERLPETIGKVVEQAQRVGGIVRRLRDFLRSGRMELRQHRVEDLIETIRGAYATQAQSSGIELQVEIEPRLPSVWVDRLEIEIVLRNLFSNAIEAVQASRPEVRRVRVLAAPHAPGFVRLSVLDSGPGVAATIRDRLFAPFTTSKASGMGLGLAVSKAIAEAHGGRLWADTTAFGAFHLTLPTTLTGGDTDEHDT